jgi:hypothetical protein
LLPPPSEKQAARRAFFSQELGPATQRLVAVKHVQPTQAAMQEASSKFPAEWARLQAAKRKAADEEAVAAAAMLREMDGSGNQQRARRRRAAAPATKRDRSPSQSPPARGGRRRARAVRAAEGSENCEAANPRPSRAHLWHDIPAASIYTSLYKRVLPYFHCSCIVHQVDRE